MRNVSQIINGQRKIIKKPELLAPAGNLEKLKVAIIYGADAVFVGGKEFSLRSQASNFTLEDIKEGVEFAKQYGASIHVTCNIILHEDNLEGTSITKSSVIFVTQANIYPCSHSSSLM